MPSTRRSFSQPSTITEATRSPNLPTSQSIQFIGYCPRVKVAVKMRYNMAMKMGNANHLLVTTASILSVIVSLGAVSALV